MSLKLHVIICSTRPGRVWPAVARWFHGFARQHGGFDAELVDLADFKLPLYDEPVHPRMQQYEHEHTKRWSASVAAADAYVFVMPEYNYMPSPALTNALDYVYREWNYKPCGFVGYGGVSGGLRAVEQLRLVFAELHAVAIRETVSLAHAWTQFDPVGNPFRPGQLNGQLAVLLKRLGWCADALKAARIAARYDEVAA